MTGFDIVPLIELADIYDYLREPVSQTERNKREGKYPYFGATGQVGWIDDYRQDGKYVLLGEDGAPFLDPHKTKAYVVEGKCWVNNHAHVLKGKEGVCDDDYLCFALNWVDYSEAVTGSTRLKLPQGTMNRLLIPKPPIEEQRKIAARLKAQLAEVETARQAAQAQVREAENLRLSIYRDAFQNTVPVTLPPVPSNAPQGWSWRKLADIARLESGHTPSRQRPDWWGGDVSWISLTEIRALDGQWVESTQLRTNAAGIANSAARILPRGTVCYSRTASVGFVCIMAAPMATSQDFANWVCGDELEPEFLMHALIRSRKELREIATGATHKTIYMPQLEAFHLCAPDIAEQRRIVARLKAQLAETAGIAQAAAAQHHELELLPRAVLAQAFDMQAAAA